MHTMRFVSISILALVLAGCSSTLGGAGLVKPQLPPLPGSLYYRCPAPPDLELGGDYRVQAGENRRAWAECTRRHRDTVAFYTGLRARLSE